VDITSQASINIPLVDDDESPVQGFPTGTLAFVPPGPLDEGVHNVEATLGDKAGNIATKSWSFVIDTAAPSLTLDTEGTIYTNLDSITIAGTSDPGSTLNIIGPRVLSIYQRDDGHFSSVIGLDEGENGIMVTAVDAAGNKAIVGCTAIYDMVAPEFDSIRFSGGSITNQPTTTITGTLSEIGTLTINGGYVNVNSDGTFSHMVDLIEGINIMEFQFIDLSGNTVEDQRNVTLDTVAPIISMSTDVTVVTNSSFELAGTVEAGAELFVNGKRTITGTRQSNEFSTILILSPGINNIVIEAEDSAGNIAQYTYIVEYDQYAYEAMDINWAAIGLMIALLVVGLVLGLLFGGMLGSGEPREEPPEGMYEEVQEEMPIDEEMPEEDGLEPVPEEAPIDEDISEEDGLEPVPVDEEIPEDSDIEEISEEEISEEDGLEPMPVDEEMPEDSDIEEISEEEVQEEMPEEEETPEELPEGAEPIPDEEGMPEEIAEEEDPRIAKLRDAFESGKISEELYEKNLAKFSEK
ncbi:MAG: hypothetical protein KAJ19_10265, partial [Gammaproteobacteria bacterium]|nr:hypothetical protein [Gammaproteobacteria bacterium]